MFLQIHNEGSIPSVSKVDPEGIVKLFFILIVYSLFCSLACGIFENRGLRKIFLV